MLVTLIKNNNSTKLYFIIIFLHLMHIQKNLYSVQHSSTVKQKTNTLSNRIKHRFICSKAYTIQINVLLMFKGVCRFTCFIPMELKPNNIM